MNCCHLVVLCVLFINSQAVPVGETKRSVESDPPEQENVHEKIYKINKKDDLNLYEGDIIISPRYKGAADLRNSGDIDGELRSKRNAVRDRKRLWLNKVVPYEFGYGFPVEYQQTVLKAIKEFHNKTCIRFKPRSSENQWILFVHKKGCWSAVGRSYWLEGVGQELSLGGGCNTLGTALHEITHALGFWHEQSRPDRNQYVEVLWENIISSEAYNFNKYSHGVVDTLKVPYDFESIMHYGTKSFSKNSKPTIRAIRTPGRTLGQKNAFTSLDVRELNALYDCQRLNSPWSSWSHFGPCSLSDCNKYRQRFCTSNNPKVDCPKADYYGVQTDFVKCSNAECYAPIDGHWGRWSAWGGCNAMCGYGNQTRTRKCDDPVPQFNGKNCVGSSTQQQRCKLRTCGLGPDDCEFDVDMMCYWKNAKSNSRYYSWMRVTGSTPTSGTGPTGDHTSNTGFYLYTEASSPATPGNKARLESKEFNATEGRCLSFWYHMYGLGMGSLNVFIQDANGKHQIWKELGNKGNQWQLGHVTISNKIPYKIIFESVRGQDFRSDIGLDDIKYDDSGPCVEEVGCYRDSTADRSFPVMYANLRQQINWFDMRKTVKACASEALKKGYKVYGIQFYGECWGGDPSQIHYKNSDPDACWSGVGKNNANFIYKIQ